MTAWRRWPANTAKVEAKEERKAAEFADMRRVKDAANESASARDTRQAAEDPGLNGIEPAVERRQQQFDGEADVTRAAWLQKGQSTREQPAVPLPNQVEPDEMFTATQPDIRPLVPAEVEQQYLRVGDKFYHPNNTQVVAFEDKGHRLETRTDSEQVAHTMVAIAKARGWDEIKVSGSETFRKEVWLEAAAKGMHLKGYTPTDHDLAELAKRAREVPAATQERQEPAAPTLAQQRAKAFSEQKPAEAVQEHPELAGAYAAAAAVQLKAEADGLNQEQRARLEARVRHNLVNAIERGETPGVVVRQELERKVELQAHAEREATR